MTQKARANGNETKPFRIIIHLDMDAFFAAVEQLDFPQYRGKPVIVGADPREGQGRGVVSTASYEARKFGIHSAMPISRAYRLCPNGIYVRPRGKRYSELSRQIMQILYDFSPGIEQVSIDEAFLDVTGCLKLLGDAPTIARNIKQRIRQETGLTASVGIASNKFIAKIASDLEKPNGLVIVEPGTEKAFLKDLPISKMWGIGKKTEPHIRKMGISTIGQLAEYDVKLLVKKLGKAGMHYWRLANGIDHRPVSAFGPAKSMSEERTFEYDIDDVDILKRKLFEIAEDLGCALRRKHIKGKTITLKIRLEDFSTFTRSHSTVDYTDSSSLIYSTGLSLFENFDRMGMKVRLIGIGMSNLSHPEAEQIGLFEEDDSTSKKLDHVIDMIQEKFGHKAITKATILRNKRNGK
ncbi:DNA polymerase IV [candidate division KSB1 bacterium]|nr:DNA polymerase IV [candidate division KSB1 bacterium]